MKQEFKFSEYAGTGHLPLISFKELNFPWLILKFPDFLNCPLREKNFKIFPGMVTHVTQ